MGDGEPVRIARPTVYLSGELTNKPIAVDVPARKTQIARPFVTMDGIEYELVAEGKLAERFAGLTLGTSVMVAGDLVKRTWKTGDGKEHQRFEVLVTRMVP